MAYNIEINFKDDKNWVDIFGNSIFWGTFDSLTKSNVRPMPFFLAPEISTVEWGGLEYDAQLKLWDGYVLKFYLTENEVNKFAKIKGVSEIKIKNLTDGTLHLPDTRKSDYFETEISKTENANLWECQISYRTGQIIINKNETSKENENKIILYNQNLDTSSVNYLQNRSLGTEYDTMLNNFENVFCTDFEVLQNAENTEQAFTETLTGTQILSFSKANKQLSFLFLANDFKTFLLKKYVSLCNTILFAENEVFDTTSFVCNADNFLISVTSATEIRNALFVGQKIQLANIITEISEIIDEVTFTTNYDFGQQTGLTLHYEKIIKIENLINIETEKIGANYNKTELMLNVETSQSYGI